MDAEHHALSAYEMDFSFERVRNLIRSERQRDDFLWALQSWPSQGLCVRSQISHENTGTNVTQGGRWQPAASDT